MRNFFRNNGLSIVLFLLFFFSIIGQYFTGFNEYNEDQKTHGKTEVSYSEYFGKGHFIEAVFKNWESEFLHMGMYVVLTIFLYQKGSSESKTPGTIEHVDLIPEKLELGEDAPAIVKRGGLGSKIYQNSLSTAFFTLFFVSLALHAVSGAKDYNEEQTEHGQPTVSTVEYMQTSRFWFESFQNWQSEFLSMGLMVVLSVFLR